MNGMRSKAAFAGILAFAGCLLTPHAGAFDNPVIDLNRKLQAGEATLAFEGPSGYLRAVLNALAVPRFPRIPFRGCWDAAYFPLRTGRRSARWAPSNPTRPAYSAN